MNYSTPGFPGLHHLPEFAQTHVLQVGDGIQLILCHLLLLLPSVFPSIRVYSNESAVHIRQPKYWRNMQQMKEHGKSPPDQTDEEELGSLPEKEFRVMIVKMIQSLGIKMEIL